MVKPVHQNRTVQKRRKPAGKRPGAAYAKRPKPQKKRTAANPYAGQYRKKQPQRKTGGLFTSTRKAGDIDLSFMLLVGVLAVFGLIMLLSASTPKANKMFGNSYHFFLRQFAYVAAGIFFMLIIARIDYRKYKPFARPFLLLCVVLLAMVFLPKIGVSHNGSRRWINLGVIEIQPSEFTKLAITMYFAAMIEDRKYNLSRLDGMLRLGGWVIVIAAEMMLETHLSGTIIICGIALCIMIAGGANLKIIGGGAAAAIGAATVYLQFDSVRMARVASFLNPFADKQADGYQIIQSLYAIGSGGIFGKGLGQGMQKFYLPEPFNDFIFAILCEELGLVGAAFIICLFIALILRGMKIASEAPDTFGTLLVTGIMAQVAIQTVLNIAVVTSSIPNTGVPLPFFSYGGTALMILLMEMGVVLSVSRYSGKNN